MARTSVVVALSALHARFRRDVVGAACELSQHCRSTSIARRPKVSRKPTKHFAFLFSHLFRVAGGIASFQECMHDGLPSGRLNSRLSTTLLLEVGTERGMTAWAETIGLYRKFLRARHSFPNKQARSTLRRWTTMYFSLRRVEYARITAQRGGAVAEAAARVWRRGAREDLGRCRCCIPLVSGCGLLSLRVVFRCRVLICGMFSLTFRRVVDGTGENG